MIFKGGSGSGVNLGPIRSSAEKLSKSAGTASGPLSFMRGADASAGANKKWWQNTTCSKDGYFKRRSSRCRKNLSGQRQLKSGKLGYCKNLDLI